MPDGDELRPAQRELLKTMIERIRYEIAEAIIAYHEHPDRFLAAARALIEADESET